MNEKLFLAALRLDVKAVSYLLKAGGNVNAKDRIGRTPLLIACDSGNLDNYMIKAPLSAANMSGSEKMKMAKRQQEKMVDLLLKQGADADAQDSDGLTPLMNAVMDSRIPIIKSLLSAGANANIKSKSNGTALFFAIVIGSPEVVQLLVEKGADVNLSVPSTLTQTGAISPLGYATSSGNQAIIDILIKAGARP